MARSSLIKIGFLITSIIVYACFGIFNFGFILFSLLTTYYGALYLKKHPKKLVYILILSLNIFWFFLFKITGGQVNIGSLSLLAPLGIAYYTLQVSSYLTDVYLKRYGPSTNFIDYALYVFYFPCLFLGPINRYQAFQDALAQAKITLTNVLNGLIRVLWGLFKKLIIAGRVNILIMALKSYSGGLFTLSACLWYFLLLYSDFSGGIDIVLGFSHMFNINLKENFDRPYLATSIKDFWHRWHMSLTSFLKDYIYIPLGGNKKGKLRQKLNIMITFLVSAFWHGPSYLFWGLFHGLFVAFPRFLQTKWPFINRLITIFIVSLLWIFFIYEDPFQALKMLGSIFTNINWLEYWHNFFNFGLDLANYLILLGASLMLFIYELKQSKWREKIIKSKIETKLLVMSFLALAIILLGVYGIGFEVSDFIYSKF